MWVIIFGKQSFCVHNPIMLMLTKLNFVKHAHSLSYQFSNNETREQDLRQFRHIAYQNCQISPTTTWNKLFKTAGCAQDHKLISKCLDFIYSKAQVFLPISVTSSLTYIIFKLGNLIRILLLKLLFEDQAEVMYPVVLTIRIQSLITIPPVRITIVPMTVHII